MKSLIRLMATQNKNKMKEPVLLPIQTALGFYLNSLYLQLLTNYPLLMPAVAGALSCALLILIFNLIYVKSSMLDQFGDPRYDNYLFIHIPLGAYDGRLGKQFQPEFTRVIVDDAKNCCTVVRWVNNDIMPFKLMAGDSQDPAFKEATRNLIIQPGDSFEFIFKKPGEHAFHGHSWQNGVVDVLPCNCD